MACWSKIFLYIFYCFITTIRFSVYPEVKFRKKWVFISSLTRCQYCPLSSSGNRVLSVYCQGHEGNTLCRTANVMNPTGQGKPCGRLSLLSPGALSPRYPEPQFLPSKWKPERCPWEEIPPMPDTDGVYVASVGWPGPGPCG